MQAWYDDGLARVDDDGVRVARYYFPLGRARMVRWPDLRGYDVHPMTAWSGRWRLWGTTRYDWWFPLDRHRPRKHRMVVLDVPGIRPVLTPDDVEALCRALDRGLAGR